MRGLGKIMQGATRTPDDVEREMWEQIEQTLYDDTPEKIDEIFDKEWKNWQDREGDGPVEEKFGEFKHIAHQMFTYALQFQVYAKELSDDDPTDLVKMINAGQAQNLVAKIETWTGDKMVELGLLQNPRGLAT